MGRYFVESHLSPEFLKTGHTDEFFQDLGKHDSLRHLLKSLDNIGEISADRCFKTITGISSGPTAFDVSSCRINLATSDGVTLRLEIKVSVRRGKSGSG